MLTGSYDVVCGNHVDAHTEDLTSQGVVDDDSLVLFAEVLVTGTVSDVLPV